MGGTGARGKWVGMAMTRRTRRAGAAAMGGRGRRNGNGEEGGATREGGLWADARGRRKKIPEREGGENEKNRWRTHHRRVILQPGSDAYVSPPVRITNRRWCCREHHRRVVLRTGGDMLASPPGPFGTGGDRAFAMMYSVVVLAPTCASSLLQKRFVATSIFLGVCQNITRSYKRNASSLVYYMQ